MRHFFLQTIVLLFLFWGLSKDVYAQQCNGYAQCCVTVSNRTYCSGNHSRQCYSDDICEQNDEGTCSYNVEVCEGEYAGSCEPDVGNVCVTNCHSIFNQPGPQNTCDALPPGGNAACTPSAPVACVEPDPSLHPGEIRVTWYSPNGVGDPATCNNCDSGGTPLLPGDPHCSIMGQAYVDSIDVPAAIAALQAANPGLAYCAQDSTLEFEGTITPTATADWGFQYITARVGDTNDGEDVIVYLNTGAGEQVVLSNYPGIPAIYSQQDALDNDSPGRSGGCTDGIGDFYYSTEVCWGDCNVPEVGNDGEGTVLCDWTAGVGGNLVPYYRQWFGETVVPSLNAGQAYPIRVVFKNTSVGKLRWFEQSNGTCSQYHLPAPTCTSDSQCPSIPNHCNMSYSSGECEYTNNQCCWENPAHGYAWECETPQSGQCTDPLISRCISPNSWSTISGSALSPDGASSCTCTSNPTCSVTVSGNNVLAGTDITASATGNAHEAATRQVRLYVETQTGDRVAVGEEITVNGITVTPVGPYNGHYYYQLSTCNSDPSIADGDCTTSVTDVTLPSGNFYFHCDVPGGGNQCTGNPFCDVNGGATVCSTSWQSCSDTDFTAFCSDEVTWNPLTCDPTYPVTRTGTHFCPVAASSDSCRGTISGTVTDASGTNGTCDTGVAPPAGGSMTINRTGGSASTSINADGTYSFASVPAAESPTGTTYTFDISSPDVFGLTGYSYLCGPTSVTITGGQTRSGMNFTIALVSEAWFQIMGGNMRAGAGSQTTGNGDITQAVPATQAMLVRDEGDHEGSTGYPVIGEASNTVTTTPGLVSSGDSHDDAQGEATRRGPKEGFTFFLQRYSMPAVPQSDFDESGGQIALTLDMLDGSFANTNRNAYYASGDNDAVTTVVINDALTIPADRSIVIFVHGNLEINNQITVAPGGFLAFLVSGNIDVDETVVAAVSPTLTPTVDDAVVQGVFVADGQITIQSVGDPTSDGQFIGAGNFVAWNGFSLNRSYRNMDNNDYPVELFFSRPDIVLNTPDEFMRPMYDWYEISP